MHETALFASSRKRSPERQEFYDRLDQQHTAPLWEVLARLVPPEPHPADRARAVEVRRRSCRC